MANCLKATVLKARLVRRLRARGLTVVRALEVAGLCESTWLVYKKNAKLKHKYKNIAGVCSKEGRRPLTLY